MASAWDVASAGWAITVLGWLLSPLISFLLPKILSCLGFDATKKLRELEMHIIPELQNTMRAVDQERMLERGKKLTSHITVLDKMASMLRHARYEAEDIFEAQQEIEWCRGRSCWNMLCRACNSSCVWIARVVRSGSARLLHWAFARRLRRSEEPLPVASTAVTSDGIAVVAIDVGSSDEQTVQAASTGEAFHELRVLAAPSDSASGEPVPLTASPGSSFHVFKNHFRSIFYWLVDAFEAARVYRNWSYEVVGITTYQENATTLDFLLTAISRRELKKRIEKVENTVNEVKKSPLLDVARKSAADDIANKNRSRIRTASNHKVFGQEALRDSIMEKLRETPQGNAASLSTSACYSVIGIYGVAGSGKTTFARYIREYIEEECKEEKLFDTIISIHVSETFSVGVIFHEMLKDITKNRHLNISDRDELEEELKASLKGKRFFLILDDLWVKSTSDPQLQELISPLNVGKKGSKILVTARTKDAARALCADEPIKMHDLDEDQYFLMFMHYALCGTPVDEELISVGREIAKKLHRSPIAAAIVAGRLGTNANVRFWKNTAKLDMSNGTMDVLWWSYQQLSADIRRCFEYCTIFPRRFTMGKRKLVQLWIAQGFINTDCARKNMEDVAEGYIQELLLCAFLQPERTWNGSYNFTIHDLLHDLAATVAGSDCIRIENARSQSGVYGKEDVPRDAHHVFIQYYDRELIKEKIFGLQSLRTLIIDVIGEDTPVETKVIESICRRLPKLRVLDVSFGEGHDKFSFPKSLTHMKHMRYISVKIRNSCEVSLPSATTKLKYFEHLAFDCADNLDFPSAGLIELRHIYDNFRKFPNLGRLISLKTLSIFEVGNGPWRETKNQLVNRNNLDGRLELLGLEDVQSKEDALEANLAAKEKLTELSLHWSYDGDTMYSPEVAAEVLEGLSPPMGLKKLRIIGYQGSRYPHWMVCKQNGGQKDLQELTFVECSLLGPAPHIEAFPRLCVLSFWKCSWDALPGNLEHLTSLKELWIHQCSNIISLPTLPQSLVVFHLNNREGELTVSCKTVGHPNWEKLKHVPDKTIGYLPTWY